MGEKGEGGGEAWQLLKKRNYARMSRNRLSQTGKDTEADEIEGRREWVKVVGDNMEGNSAISRIYYKDKSK